MSTFKKIFKRKYTNKIQRRHTKIYNQQELIEFIKSNTSKHITIEDGCNKTSTDQLDFKVL